MTPLISAIRAVTYASLICLIYDEEGSVDLIPTKAIMSYFNEKGSKKPYLNRLASYTAYMKGLGELKDEVELLLRVKRTPLQIYLSFLYTHVLEYIEVSGLNAEEGEILTDFILYSLLKAHDKK